MKGTYAGVRFGRHTKRTISEYIKEYEVPNPIHVDKLHTTLLYSRKHLPNYVPAGKYDNLIVGMPKKFDAWATQEGKIALVLEYDAPDLVARHKHLMKTHEATYDYDEYKPHITLSYDVGNEFEVSTLPSLSGIVIITEEYHEPLDLDWAEKDAG